MITSDKLVSTIAFAMLTTQAFAYDFKSGHPILQLGGYLGSKGKSQTIRIQNLVGDQFSISDDLNGNGLFGLGYFQSSPEKEFHDGTEIDLIFGINAFYFAKTSVSGTITQEQLCTSLSYHYDVMHSPIYFTTKTIFTNNINRYAVTFDAGIGPNITKTTHYKDQSLDDGVTLPDHAFSGHTNVSISAMAGIGFALNDLFGTAPLECGLRFFYLGRGELHQNSSQILDALKTGTNYANAVMCTVSL